MNEITKKADAGQMECFKVRNEIGPYVESIRTVKWEEVATGDMVEVIFYKMNKIRFLYLFSCGLVCC